MFGLGQRVRVIQERRDIAYLRLVGAVGTIVQCNSDPSDIGAFSGFEVRVRLDHGTFSGVPTGSAFSVGNATQYAITDGVWFRRCELAPLAAGDADDNVVEEP